MADIVIEGGRKTLSYEMVTVDNTTGGKGFTSTKILGTGGTTFEYTRACQEVFCKLETGPIRFTLDGVTAPTTTVGILLGVGDTLTICNPWDIYNFRAIRTTATSGELHVFFKF